ncbi:MAG: type IV secretory system conjugative DNA transfer family protein [Oscillospiraceae bacterium]|nr:type IV secretory system conjugative DNA transfer family protein [Oscillospiraceae bacterium]
MIILLLNRILIAIILIVLLIITIKIVRFVKFKAAFQKQSGLKARFSKKASGIILGKNGFRLVCSPETNEGMTAVFGGSGSGKTSALLIPTLRAWQGTAFVIDISGDIEKAVPNPSKIVFAPENTDTTPYNAFAMVDMAIDDEEKQETGTPPSVGGIMTAPPAPV